VSVSWAVSGCEKFFPEEPSGTEGQNRVQLASRVQPIGGGTSSSPYNTTEARAGQSRVKTVDFDSESLCPKMDISCDLPG
jgi:hypothetical protein